MQHRRYDVTGLYGGLTVYRAHGCHNRQRDYDAKVQEKHKTSNELDHGTPYKPKQGSIAYWQHIY